MNVKSFVEQIAIANPLIVAALATGKSTGSELLAVAVTDISGAPVFSQIVKPTQCRYWPTVEKLSGITRQVVADKPLFSDIAPQLLDILYGRCLVAWHPQHERRVLSRTATMQGLTRFAMLMVNFGMHDMAMLYAKSINHNYETLTAVCHRLGIESQPQVMGDPLAQCRLTGKVMTSLLGGVAQEHSLKFD